MTTKFNVSPFLNIKYFYTIFLDNGYTVYLPPFAFQRREFIYFETQKDVIFYNCLYILENPAFRGTALQEQASHWLVKHNLPFIKLSDEKIISKMNFLSSVYDKSTIDLFTKIFPKNLYTRLAFDPDLLNLFLTNPGEFEYRIDTEANAPLYRANEEPTFLEWCENYLLQILSYNVPGVIKQMISWAFHHLNWFLINVMRDRISFLKSSYMGYPFWNDHYENKKFVELCNYCTAKIQKSNKQIKENPFDDYDFTEAECMDYIKDRKNFDVEILDTEFVRKELVKQARKFNQMKDFINYMDMPKNENKFIYNIKLKKRHSSDENYWFPTKWTTLWDCVNKVVPFNLISTLLGCFKILHHKCLDYFISESKDVAVFNFEVKYQWCTTPGYLWGFGNDITGMNIFGETVSPTILDNTNAWIMENLKSTNRCYAYNIEFFNLTYMPNIIARQKKLHEKYLYTEDAKYDKTIEVERAFNEGNPLFPDDDNNVHWHTGSVSSGVRNLNLNYSHVLNQYTTPYEFIKAPGNKEKVRIGGKHYNHYWNPIKSAFVLKENGYIAVDITALTFLKDWNAEFREVEFDNSFSVNIVNNISHFKTIESSFNFLNNNPGILNSEITSLEMFLLKYIEYNFEERFKPWLFNYSDSAIKDSTNKCTLLQGPETQKGGYYTYKLYWKDNPFYTMNWCTSEINLGYAKPFEGAKVYRMT